MIMNKFQSNNQLKYCAS